MINHKDTGDVASYYGYNPHTDVEMLYKPDGSVEGTYGYTAYGKEDKAATTGVDDPDPADNFDPNYDPDDPVNDYRYSAKRWDPSTKSYDMGFRDYSPGMNRFTTLDMYNGALQDMGLSTSPWTNNRYGFAGGNPISNIEWDGHVPLADGVYQTAPVSDYNRAISVGENLYGTSIKKDAGYDTRRAYEAWSNSALKTGSTERQIASFAAGFIPGVGESQDLTILFAGYDPVSGEEISNWYGLALFLPFVGGGTLRGAVKGVDEIGEGFEVLSRRWSNGGAKGLYGKDFEDYLTNTLGGKGSFQIGGRDFDGGIGNRWWEAKSGPYWESLMKSTQRINKFKSDMGSRLRIARGNGATYELHSNTPIPSEIKSWLNKKGIKYYEWLD